MLPKEALDQLFLKARTHVAWQNKPVSDDTLRQVYDAMKFGPTSANMSPARFVFVKSGPAKEKLLKCLDAGNVEKTKAAPVTAIVAYDLEFYEKMPRLFPHADARSWFVGKPDFIQTAAFRNGSLQGGYFILAARAFDLDCGPMSGFDNAKLDEAFFKGTSWKSNFICNLGYGDPAKLHPRNPRLDFEEACKIV